VNGQRQFIKQHTIWEVVLIRGHIKKGLGHARVNTWKKYESITRLFISCISLVKNGHSSYLNTIQAKSVTSSNTTGK